MLTDANGRQMMERARKQARTIEDIFESSNYYPVTARSVYEDGGLRLETSDFETAISSRDFLFDFKI